MNGYTYLTGEYERRTKYKSIRDAINRDYFSVVKYGGSFWLETRGCPPTIYTRAVKELRALFPELRYVYDA